MHFEGQYIHKVKETIKEIVDENWTAARIEWAAIIRWERERLLTRRRRKGEIAEHGELPRGPILGPQNGGDRGVCPFAATSEGFIFTAAKIQPELPDKAAETP
ncbi:PREDICTED: uncharacterized protein LOC105150905 [Acromyrmex echinatior]|uniref:uncharacterized protein LOC105150905 n=1 Tax=Acromyrmex echinatior TaxID=103372 RepID=UPI000580E953|nr:PREDICTED: uncharacterized protein LOC105150905 [Acromyrmex echinatior]